MYEHARNLEFEEAAGLRDKIKAYPGGQPGIDGLIRGESRYAPSSFRISRSASERPQGERSE